MRAEKQCTWKTETKKSDLKKYDHDYVHHKYVCFLNGQMLKLNG